MASIRLPYIGACWLITTLLLSACSGDNASDSNITAGGAQPGPTPFISLLPLNGSDLRNVTAYSYTIEPKPGAVSSAVNVTYPAGALARRGYINGNTVTLPVFGLYAGHTNRVTMQLEFIDRSLQQFGIDIAAPIYVDPDFIYGQPNILKRRSPDSALGFSYFLMKSQFAGPVVVDTDGEIRWVAPSGTNAFSSIFRQGGFVIGKPESVGFSRLELDGSTSTATLASPNYKNFHHTIDGGKFGLLGEVDAISGGVDNIESVLTEFGPSGTIIKEWDFADLLSRYMRAQGDDPSPFVRPGVDWFHMNAAAYDPRDDSIIASSRENFVVKVDYRTGDLKWIFGDPTKYWYSFPSLRAKALQLDAGGLYPIGQHALSLTSTGLLMLFNNGAPSFNQPPGAPIGESRPYSAVSAYTIDPAMMTAHETWRFDYDQTILSDICSSAYEALDGSILISYATANNRTKARLVGLDTARNVVFDFEYASLAPCATSWNAEPIPFEAMFIQ